MMGGKSNWRQCRLILVVLSLFVWANHADAEMVLLHVFVNEQDQGDQFFHMLDDGDVLMPLAMLEQLGLKHLPQGKRVTLEGELQTSLSSLQKSLKYRYDESDLSLHITADTASFATHTVDLTRQSVADVVRSRDASAFLNYGLSETRDHQFQSSSTRLSLESGVSIEGVLGFSSYSYARSPKNSSKFIRLLSNLTYDDVEGLQRVVLGDFSANSGELGGGDSFAGLSISRRLDLDPNLVVFPGLNMRGVLETPSDVDIYVNDRLVDSAHLAPGPFDVQNISANAGAGDVRLVIRDAFGRESEISMPFYQVTALLKPSLHNYSYNVGVKRRQLGLSNFSYAEPTVLAFHHYGATTWLTLGLRGEADQRTLNGGPVLALALGGFGQLSASGAVGSRRNTAGMAGSLNYSFNSTFATFGAGLTSYSKRYVHISSPDQPLLSQRLRASASMGVNLASFGSLSGSLLYADAYNASSSKSFSLTYSYSLFQDASLQLRGSATKTDIWSSSLFVGINVGLGKAGSGSIQHSQQDKQAIQSIDFSHNAPSGTGFGGRAHIERSRQQNGKVDHNGNLFTQYNAPHGIYTTSLRQSAQQNSYGFGLAGSLAWIDHGVYFSRPINDAFALVKVKGLKSITVLNSNNPIGKTDSNGNLLVPGILSHYGNDISIDPEDIAINYEINTDSQKVAAPLRGGVVIDFDVRKLQAFIGRLQYISKGKTAFAKYWGLELIIDGQPKQYVLGDEGDFYLENIAASEYEARIFDKHHNCSFVMNIPDSDGIMVDMGDVRCDDSNSFSKPENAAVSPVQVEGVKNITVLKSKSPAEKMDSNSNKDILMPKIILNNGNSISIDAEDISIKYDIDSDAQQMTVPLREGELF